MSNISKKSIKNFNLILYYLKFRKLKILKTYIKTILAYNFNIILKLFINNLILFIYKIKHLLPKYKLLKI